MKKIKMFKLSAMMFVQFMLVAVFFAQLASYLGTMDLSRGMIQTIMGTMAFGFLLAPIIGMLADRFFNGERVLLVLNLIVAVFLFLAARTTSPNELFIFLLLAMLAYTPTWSLTSSIAITNSTPESFPYIRVFGSIGWISSAVFAFGGKYFFDTKIDGTNIPLYCGAGIALFAALLAFTLPQTPPPAKGKPISVIDALGLRAFGLMKDRNFAVLIICSALAMLPFSIYWLNFSEFLKFKAVEHITPTMNIGQISEMLFMLTVPFAIRFFGVKWTIVLGTVAMALRYFALSFSADASGMSLVIFAIALHGIIFGYLFITGQVYVGQKAPKDLQGQAQGMLFLMVFGIAQTVGTYFTGWIIDFNTETLESVAKTNWASIFMTEAVLAAAIAVVFALLFKNNKTMGN